MGVLALKVARTLAGAALLLAAAGARCEIAVDSSEGKEGITGEVHATFDRPFATVAAALKDPSHWCEILMLHLDTKECHVALSGERTIVGVGVVSHYDQPASSAYRVSFGYRRVEDTPASLQVRLDADVGPVGTSNYRILLEAAPTADGHTSIHMSYAYSYGVLARIAMEAYLVTFGRNKVGFTVTGTEPDGQPRYIGGMRGVVERNTMRYYLAVEAYLDALSAPPEARREKSLANWYEAVERYPRQLHEMARGDYLAMKRRELTEVSARSGN